jgi:ubiquinone biosynthesis protein
MGLSLKPERLKRYKDFALLLWRHGRSDLIRSAGLEETLAADEFRLETASANAQELARDLEKMGPTFIKMGQLLSTRADILTTPYLEALARLQDHVSPFPHEEVAEIIRTELGMPLEEAFKEFDEKPLASASLGQVHRATLPDGTPVAVKVQRPRIRDQIADDLASLRDIAQLLDRHTESGRRIGYLGFVEEFRRSIVRELDYRQEAQNLITLAANLEQFQRLVVPLPVEDYTTSRVLTMDYVRGNKLSPVALLQQPRADGAELAEELFRAYLKQVLVDGFFHADPHPGNLFITDDNRIALLDLGMVAQIAPPMQDKLLQWLLAIAEGRGDDAATIALRIGKPKHDMDRNEFRRRVAELVMRGQGARIGSVEVGRVVMEVARLAGEFNLGAPRELTMLGKTLLNLDYAGRVLAPDFDPNTSIRKHAAEIARQRMVKSLQTGSLFKTFFDVKELASKLPTRVSRILDTVAANELQVKVNAIDERRLIAGLHKIANRITLGLILAALVIAAAMLMRIPTTFELFGYPGIAILLFLGAGGGGIALALTIVMHDRMPNRVD